MVHVDYNIENQNATTDMKLTLLTTTTKSRTHKKKKNKTTLRVEVNEIQFHECMYEIIFSRLL